ncbi:MAG TPA: class I SAM-dependent methyltransferase [Nitrospira sp.]|nr:class I SAM-dependent methyltransferase [Nitrospira sp.]
MTTEMANQETVIGCPCGAVVQLAEVFHTPTRRYVRCPACDLIFLYPRPSRELVEDYFREAYDGDYGAVEACDDRQPVYRSVLKHLSLYRSSPGALLDVGCGDGEFLLLCRRAGWDCTGTELSEQAATRAARKGLTIVPPHTLEDGEDGRHFDVVVLINVLETVADPLTMLRQAADLLTPRGLVMVRATNGLFHLPMRTPARLIGSRYDQAFHWYLYTTRSLKTLMESVGLKVISLRNSRPSRGPLSPVHPWFSRLKWAVSRALLWPLAQTLYHTTGGRIICAPSFEIVAQRPGNG